MRIIYTLGQAWRHRSALKKVLLKHGAPSILSVNPVALKASGFGVLVLDFDGVMAPHGMKLPNPEVMTWLDTALDVYGAGRVFILSNKPFGARLCALKMRFPLLEPIIAPRKKPYPDGLKRIAIQTGIEAESTVLIDDRLLTGALAAIQTGVHIIYIESPYRAFMKKPIAEGFFASLRALERFWIALFG